jgi:hypothetical protein
MAGNGTTTLEFCALGKRIGAEHVELSAYVVANDAEENSRYHGPTAEIVAENLAAARALASG